jgi:hypothetical protein
MTPSIFVGFTLSQTTKTFRERYSSTLFLTSALEGGEGSTSHSGCNLPPGKTRYPFYRRLVGPQGRSGQVWKISPALGFDPRTVQPIGSRYTDYATRTLAFHHYPFQITTKLSSNSTLRYLHSVE